MNMPSTSKNDACASGVATSLAVVIGLENALHTVILHFEAINAFTTYAETWIDVPIIQDAQTLSNSCAMHDEAWFLNLGDLAGMMGLLAGHFDFDTTTGLSGSACIHISSSHELQGKQDHIINLLPRLHRKILFPTFEELL